MKVLFLTIYPESLPSSRFRARQYLPLLEKEGIVCRFSPSASASLFKAFYGKASKWRRLLFFLLVISNRARDILSLPFYNVVVVQKGIMPFRILGMAKLVRILSRRLIFDIDDAIHLNFDTSLPKLLSFLEQQDQVRELVSLSDVVVVGNGSLKDFAARFNKNVVVIPTPIDTDIFRRQAPAVAKDKNIIGWIGSEGTNKYVNRVIPVLNALRADFNNIQFWICSNSDRHIRFDELKVEFKFLPWSLRNEKTLLDRIDIGVMPLPDSEWERYKCGFKLLEYMSCGVPSIASPVGVNQEIIRDGENGLFAAGEEEWRDKLRLLIQDKELRKKFAANGRKTAVERYSLKRIFPLFLRVIREQGIVPIMHGKIDGDFYDREYYEGKGKSSYIQGYSYETMHVRFMQIVSYLCWRFRPAKLLDIGCAKGLLVQLLRENGVESHGVDVSEYALSEAPEGIKKFLHRIDIENKKLPFKEKVFDGVTIIDVLEHLRDHSLVIEESRRVLKEGAFLFVVTPEQATKEDVSHINLHTRKFWVKEISSFGFKHLDERKLRSELVLRSLALAPRTIAGKALLRIPGGGLLRRAVLRIVHRRKWKWMMFLKKGAHCSHLRQGG